MYNIKDINNVIKNIKSENESAILYLGGEFIDVKSEEVRPKLLEEYSIIPSELLNKNFEGFKQGQVVNIKE